MARLVLAVLHPVGHKLKIVVEPGDYGILILVGGSGQWYLQEISTSICGVCSITTAHQLSFQASANLA